MSILNLIAQGENSSIEFKQVEVRPDSLAKELIAFSNTNGGVVLIGVDDNGNIIGTEGRENIEEWVVNIARNNVIPAISPKIEKHEINGKTIVSIEVERELSRLFQQAGLVHYDIAPLEGTSIIDLDERKLNQYWQNYYDIDYRQLEEQDRFQLLRNADILSQNDLVTVGGLLIFGVEPQRRLWQSAITFAVFDGVDLTEKLLELFQS
jgi:ATP-dependent DNA helicase RecG